jgi:ADP-ribose pyrophosphatase YjhB (NUDIX family)
MHITPEVLAPVEAIYGQPRELSVGAALGEREFGPTWTSVQRQRNHDVSLFIMLPGDRIVLIQKWTHPPGVWRAPSGGVKLNEDFVAGALREGYEETGLSVGLTAYVLRLNATFTCQLADGVIREVAWVSHVFSASIAANSGPLQAVDTREIKAARIGTVQELQGPIRQALLTSPSGGLHYRALLTDLTITALYPSGIL